MKKLKLKKIKLAEMSSETMNKINGGGDTFTTLSVGPITTIYSITISVGCDDPVSYGCQLKD